MQLGIFAKTFTRPTLEGVLDAVASHGLRTVQFNFACAGLPSMPERIEPDLADRIHSAMTSRRISISAISGTFNMIHPDTKKRRDGLQRLREIAAVCRPLGAGIITLCTGTRDPEDMWQHHPDNSTPEAWKDLMASLHEALTFAEEHNVTFGIEPEINNVVDSAPKARRLLDEMRTSRLKIVIDPANLFRAGELQRMRAMLDEAFELLGQDIVIAHAKDLVEDSGLRHVAAGKGNLDYAHYVAWLRRINFNGDIIMHGLAEEEVDGGVGFLRQKLASNI